jgi:hypothetical protein
MELSNRLKLVIILGALLFVVFLIWTGRRKSDSGLPELDPYNYKSVAAHFVVENAVIAKKLGKIMRFSIVGDGGGGGKVSYNVYRLYGEEGTGVCEFTLTKDTNGKWTVTNAFLTAGGVEFKLPIKGLKGRKGFKIF